MNYNRFSVSAIVIMMLNLISIFNGHFSFLFESAYIKLVNVHDVHLLVLWPSGLQKQDLIQQGES